MNDQLAPPVPTDIIRKVVAYANHSVGELQLVSHLWNELVREQYTRPFMDGLEIVIAKDGDLKVVEAILTNRFFNFAMLDLAKVEFKITKSADGMFTAKKQLVEVVIGGTDAFSAIKHVNRVVIRGFADYSILLPRIFRDVRATEICVIEREFSPQYNNEVINLIRAWSATKAIVVIEDTPKGKPLRRFLSEVAELVDTVHIVQKNAKSRFIGISDMSFTNWTTIMAEWFAKRVSKIKIEHDCTLVSERDGLKELLQKLDGLDKKPWLELEVPGFRTMKEKSNDILLDVSRIMRGDLATGKCLISMKHRSRIDEPF